jgi:uncharacterized membrane protein required for colicin V production
VTPVAPVLPALGPWIGDGAVVAVLFLFGMWGYLRGVLRQVVSLGLLAAAFWIAGTWGARLEDVIDKVASPTPQGRCVAAWLTTLVGTFVVGSGVLGGLSRLVPRAPVRGGWLGCLRGLVKGAVVLIPVLYGLLGAWPGDPRPGFVAEIEAGRAVRIAAEGASLIGRVAPVPACVRAEVAAVDARVRR